MPDENNNENVRPNVNNNENVQNDEHVQNDEQLDFTPIVVGEIQNVDDLRAVYALVMEQIRRFSSLSSTTLERLSPNTLEALDRRRYECENLGRGFNVLPSLGVIGNVASGKTSVVEMLHGLIGGPLFLSVGQNATTGNIVEYNIIYEPGDDRTEPSYDDWNVVFLSEEDLNRLTVTYRDEIVKNARYVIDSEELKNFGILCDDVNCEVASWNERWHTLRGWAIDNYNGLDPERHGSLRKAIYELFLLAECAYVYRCWFGRTEKISADQAAALLTLSADNTPPLELAARDNFFESKEIANVSVKDIHNLFFLVKNLRTTVRVSQAAAQAFAVPEISGTYRLRIVDCPGLGSVSSPIRDRALCLEQLKDLDVVLALLDVGAQVELMSVRRLVDMIDPNGVLGILKRVVVVVNKFDSILTTPQERNKLGRIERFDSVQDALDGFASFQAIYTSARNILNDTPNALERISFLSPYCFVGNRQEFATRDFIEQTWKGAFADACAASKETLKTYAEKIPGGALKQAFDDFLVDGGTARLHNVYSRLIQDSGRLHQTASLNRDLRELVEKWNALKRRMELELTVVEVPVNGELTPEQMLNALRKLDGLIEGLASVTSIWRKHFNYYVRLEKGRSRKEVAFRTFLSRFWKTYFNAEFSTDGGKISLADRGFLPERTDDKTLLNRYFENLRDIASEANAYVKKYAIPLSFRDYMRKQNYVAQNNLDREIEAIVKSVQKALELKREYGQEVERLRVVEPDPLQRLATGDVMTFDKCLTSLFSEDLLQELANLTENDWDYEKYYPLQMKRVENSTEQGAYFAWSDLKQDNEKITVVKRQKGSLGVAAVQKVFISSGVRFAEDFLEESKARVFKKVKSICNSLRTQINYYTDLAEYWQQQRFLELGADLPPTTPAVDGWGGFEPPTPTDEELNEN